MSNPSKASIWREQRNEVSRSRLARALPAIFPAAVLVHAYARPLVPPLPRLAMESYWRAHPLRADRLSRALAARSAVPAGWTWSVTASAQDGAPRTFRTPPTPFREKAFSLGAGFCRVCGQPVYRFGWHCDLWDDGAPNKRAEWHACCVAAWKFWTAPNQQGHLLRRLQRRRCGATGQRALRGAEVDHRTPLFKVWREHRDMPWPGVLRFWGLPNLQVINQDAHASKSAGEATTRAITRMSRADVGGGVLDTA